MPDFIARAESGLGGLHRLLGLHEARTGLLAVELDRLDLAAVAQLGEDRGGELRERGLPGDRAVRGTLYIAWRYLAFHRFKTAILVTSISLILYLPVGLQVLDGPSCVSAPFDGWALA